MPIDVTLEAPCADVRNAPPEGASVSPYRRLLVSLLVALVFGTVMFLLGRYL